MAKQRSIQVRGQAGLLAAPGLAVAPVLDLMCSHFVLSLAAQQGSKFNVRRDINGLMALAGRHLIWPEPVLARLREFLGRRLNGTGDNLEHRAQRLTAARAGIQQ
mgnify:CR=1 FL=1